MQASKIQLGQTYAATDGFDFRATAVITVRRNGSTSNRVEGVKLPLTDPPVTVEVEVKDIIDLAETHARLQREAEARDAEARADKAAREAKRAKAVRLLAAAIGVTADPKGDYKIDGPKVATRYSGVEVADDTLDALIAYLEAK